MWQIVICQNNIGNNNANRLWISLQKFTKLREKMTTLEHINIKVFEGNTTLKT
jgi:hypothetical protein